MKKPSKVEADKKLGGVIGQLVGDATGAPYEFFPHTDATLENIPDILKYRRHSDDSSRHGSRPRCCYSIF